jgi:transposase, IS5 family
MQMSLFDYSDRLKKLDKNKDPLVLLDSLIPWEEFRPLLEEVRIKNRKSKAGRPPFDVVLMFKILILQSLYNLSDDTLEFQILDRLSFMRFLSLGINDKVPDSKTIWLFRKQLEEAELLEKIFTQFDKHIRSNGFEARSGQIIDASFIHVPIQRNSRDENKLIKEDETLIEWTEKKAQQKDVDARWTKKNGVSHYGYKNHISIDAKYKFIRTFEITAASTHDSQVFESLFDPNNSNRDMYADSAYRSEEHDTLLIEKGYRNKLQRRAYKGRPLKKNEIKGNKTRSKVRSRVEHVFGVQAMMAKDRVIRGVGIVRIQTKVALRNIGYNMMRFSVLANSSS